jgi:hypothetical protein
MQRKWLIIGRKAKNLVGLKFNDLKVISRAEDKIEKNGRHTIMWNCECICGNYTTVDSYSLKNGHTKSCGCRRSKHIGNSYDLSGEYGIGYTSKGEEFWFDLEDYDKIKDYTWYKNSQGYFCSVDNGKSIRLHRLVMGYPDKVCDVDHKRHNLFDNRKSELRICRHSDNVHNHIQHKHNTSGESGVYFENYTNKWKVTIKYLNKNISIRRFDNFEDAVRARKQAEEKYFGEYSYDNSQEVNV